MNVPDTHVPVIKTMHVDFVRRCVGDIRATATLSENDYHRVHQEDKGDVSVQVQVVDESDNEPIKAEMIWAWVNKSRKKKTATNPEAKE